MYHPSYPFESLGLNSFMYAGPSNDSSPSRSSNGSIGDNSDPILLTPTTLSEDIDQYYQQQLLEQPSSCIHPFDISFDIAASFDEAFFTTSLDTSSSAFMTPSSSSSSSSSLSSTSPSPKSNYSSHTDYTHTHHQQYHTSSYHQDLSDFSTPYHFETPPPPAVEEIITTPQMTNISFELDSEDEQIENDYEEDDNDDNYTEDQQSIQFEEEDPEDDFDWPADTTTDAEYEPDDHVYTEQPHHSPTAPSPSPRPSSSSSSSSSQPLPPVSRPKTTRKNPSTHSKSLNKRRKEKRRQDSNPVDLAKSSSLPALTAEVPRCSHCSTLNTPLWRRNVEGLPLCNACGLFLKLHGTARPLSLYTDVIKKRNRGGSGSLSSSTSKRKRSLRAARKGSKKRSK